MKEYEKVIRIILWLTAICIGGYLTARGFMKLRESPSKQSREFLEAAYMRVSEEAVWCYLPGCFYNEENPGSLLDDIYDRISDIFPLHTYLKQTQPAQVMVEDESTCHEIIAANGDTITERILSENQGEAIKQENQAAGGGTQNAENDATQSQKGQGGTAQNTESQSGTVQEAEGQDGIAQNTESQSGTVQEAEGQGGTVQNTENQSGTVHEAESQSGTVQNDTAANPESQSMPEASLPAWAQAVEMAPVKDLSMEQLSNFDYLLNNFFVVDPNTTIDGSQLDAGSMIGDELKLTGTGASPQILIYHTHSQEGYADSIEGDENTSVIGVGNYLESLLRDVFGYNVIHIKDTFDIVDGQLERSKAYNYALPRVQQVLDENPSIEVVIDLHRDGVPDDKHLVTQINGKPTAQIMYFNGLSKTVKNGNLDSLPNPYIPDNLAFAFQLSYQAARYYPELTRCIYLKGYRYNLHVRPRSILLEVGAQTNTVEEAMNAMEPFSVILNKVLKGE
jgi:stage II sporulation protein P